jgi:hypothetical protein
VKVMLFSRLTGSLDDLEKPLIDGQPSAHDRTHSVNLLPKKDSVFKRTRQSLEIFVAPVVTKPDIVKYGYSG